MGAPKLRGPLAPDGEGRAGKRGMHQRRDTRYKLAPVPARAETMRPPTPNRNGVPRCPQSDPRDLPQREGFIGGGVLFHPYFRCIDALNFSMAHDDGQLRHLRPFLR